jgi:hypothetical protein
MDENSLNATEIAIGSLLAGRGGYGYGGGGAWGGGDTGYGPWASPSANAVRLNRNAQQVENQADCTRELLSTQNQGIRDNFESITRGNQFNNVIDCQFRGELRTSDLINANNLNQLRNNAELRQQIADCCCDNKTLILETQLKNQECCCETQKLIFSENQKTRDMINENALRAATDANNVSATVGQINSAAAANTAAIVAAIQGINSHHGRG